MSRINQEIDAAAADWVARLDHAPLVMEERYALESWLAIDTRHHGAFVRMLAVAAYAERARALGPIFADQYLPRSTHSVSYRRTWAIAASAVLLVAVLLVLRIGSRSQIYETERGASRVISLADGSLMTLNTASRAQVQLTNQVRSIRLIAGEALFDVTKDPARPFVVLAGTTTVRALGTSFAVRNVDRLPIQVIVREGVVEVQQPSAAPLRVAANMRADLPLDPATAAGKAIPISADTVSRELAWKDGQLSFESETLSAAAETFGRYSATRIVIDDPEVAAQEITGLFAANDPVNFARAASKSLGLRVEVGVGEVRIRR